MLKSLHIPIKILPIPPLPLSTLESVKDNLINVLKLDTTVEQYQVSQVYLDLDPGNYNSDFNISCNILGVIGIIHVTNEIDFDKGLAIFKEKLSKYPKSMGDILMVYDSRGGSRDKSLSNVVMISNLKEKSVYQQGLEELVINIIGNLGKMILDLEKKTLAPSPNQNVLAPTFTSSPSNLNLPPVAHLSKEEGNSTRMVFTQFFSNDKKSAKKNAGRILKLQSDIFALIGRFDLAVKNYTSCIEIMKGNSDSLWHASAIEGLISCQLGQFLLNSWEKSNKNKYSDMVNKDLIEASDLNKELKNFIQEIPDKFRDVVYLYNKSESLAIYGMQVSLKIADFLSEMILTGVDFNSPGMLSGAGYFIPERNLAAEIASGLSRTTDKIYLPLSSNDVSSWIMKIWNDLKSAPSVEQICALGEMTTILGRIGYYRKQSFFLYQLVKEISALSIPNSGRSLINCMESLCKILGVDNIQQEMGDWLDEFHNDDDLKSTDGQKAKDVKISRIRYGWPRLQILALQECIEISETNGEYRNCILYITSLLRQLHKFLSKKEQSILCEKLHTILLKTQELESDDFAQDSHNTNATSKGNQAKLITGVPILRQIIPVEQAARKLPVKHPKSDWDITSSTSLKSKKVFIYNPYEKTGGKQKQEILLIVGEMAYFDITLANPFSFEIDIQSITLNTSGIQFTSIPIEINIPPATRAHSVRLSGIAQEAGRLTIKGCHVRMLGGCIDEDIVFLAQLLGPLKYIDGKYRKQTPKEMIYGRHQLKFIGQISSDKENILQKIEKHDEGMSFACIEKQPFLQLVDSTNAESQVSLIVLEGERTNHSFEVENSSDVTIDFFTVMFIEDSIDEDESKIQSPEDVYEKDVFSYSLRTFWLEKVYLGDTVCAEPDYKFFADSAPIMQPKMERILLSLAPKERAKIQIGIFGKKDCTAGSLVLEYGRSTGISNGQENFYTRQLRISFNLTIQVALEAKNIDFLNYQPKDLAIQNTVTRGLSDDELLFDAIRDNSDLSAPKSDHERCSITFDIQNKESLSFEIIWETFDNDASSDPKNSYRSSLQAKTNKRFILPIDTFVLPDSFHTRPIPAPTWKQFVIGKLKKTALHEESNQKLLFWYKQVLIGGLDTRGRIIGRWSKGRKGIISLRSLRLSNIMLDILKRPEISLSASISIQQPLKEDYTHTVCNLYDTNVLNINVSSQRDEPIKLTLRILPVQTNGSEYFEADSDSIAYHGCNQMLLPLIGPGETHSQKIPFICLSKGKYGFLYQVEEIRPGAPSAQTCEDFLDQSLNRIIDLVVQW